MDPKRFQVRISKFSREYCLQESTTVVQDFFLVFLGSARDITMDRCDEVTRTPLVWRGVVTGECVFSAELS